MSKLSISYCEHNIYSIVVGKIVLIYMKCIKHLLSLLAFIYNYTTFIWGLAQNLI